MKPQKQLNRHRPTEGIFGDCHRTAIAVILDMDAADVPHFMDGKDGKGADLGVWEAQERWLNERGMTAISVAFPGECPLDQVLLAVKNANIQQPNLCYMLGGESANGVNHSVVCRGAEIVCDPGQDDPGIVGPCDDGFYWVTFMGSLRGVDRTVQDGRQSDAA